MDTPFWAFLQQLLYNLSGRKALGDDRLRGENRISSMQNSFQLFLLIPVMSLVQVAGQYHRQV